jgi:hypothetical protein
MIILNSWEEINPKILKEIVIDSNLNINGILDIETYI